ncbi:hypothetical protein [Limosilactobacillus mucosae]|uniref:Uncharacterized protein n=1 Tax=Limosilactobacillus mucosae TaxID=97478 RepID=A0AAJ1M9Y7_LIMMU|nr:hypothetical protein [Limosilactobacillus mucosae]MDC2828434.1 hypothetical protein [Limosilactobacillus mucosae]MDC2834332.1 hypothetical protein [Limosilactobacillus mucosae]
METVTKRELSARRRLIAKYADRLPDIEFNMIDDTSYRFNPKRHPWQAPRGCLNLENYDTKAELESALNHIFWKTLNSAAR